MFRIPFAPLMLRCYFTQQQMGAHKLETLDHVLSKLLQKRQRSILTSIKNPQQIKTRFVQADPPQASVEFRFDDPKEENNCVQEVVTALDGTKLNITS